MADINDSGWKFTKNVSQVYLVRRCFSEENYKVQLTDHKRLWSAEGTACELLHMSRTENPLCEFNLSMVTQNIFNVFDESLDSLRVEGNDVKLKTLTMSTSLGNRPFNLVWTLTDQGPDVLYDEVTGPLLRFVGEMGQRMSYLCKEICNRDMEISDHLTENGPLKWGRIKTEKFNQEEFLHMFLYNNTTDPILSVWEKYDVLPIFNKYVFGSKQKVEENVQTEKSTKNGVIVKQDEACCDKEELPENNCVPEPKIEVPQVKEENGYLPSISKTTQSKRKKPKLNL